MTYLRNIKLVVKVDILVAYNNIERRLYDIRRATGSLKLFYCKILDISKTLLVMHLDNTVF